jgi:2-oxoglutarate ferredoxin oxidoreductase subunit alpha
MLNLSWLWPFPKEQVEQVIKSSKNVVVVEGNIGGQLVQLIASQTGFIAKNRINRYDGRPFYTEEIVNFVKNFKTK